jgi:hypothetical protein
VWRSGHWVQSTAYVVVDPDVKRPFTAWVWHLQRCMKGLLCWAAVLGV